MYPSRKPLCRLPPDEVPETDRVQRIERDPSTGTYNKVTHFSDGSSTYHFGGPVGDVSYDELGEEC